MWFVYSETGVDFVHDSGHDMEEIIQQLAKDYPTCIYFEADLCAPEEPHVRIPDSMLDKVPDVTFDSWQDAQTILTGLESHLDDYDVVTVADYRQMAGLPVDHQNYKWGWKDLSEAVIIYKHFDKYILDLPWVERL